MNLSKAASKNWMNIWTVVTNSGKGKLKWSGENIHLLYTESTVAKRNLNGGVQRFRQKPKAEWIVPCQDETKVDECIYPPNAFLLCLGRDMDMDVGFASGNGVFIVGTSYALFHVGQYWFVFGSLWMHEAMSNMLQKPACEKYDLAPHGST